MVSGALIIVFFLDYFHMQSVRNCLLDFFFLFNYSGHISLFK